MIKYHLTYKKIKPDGKGKLDYLLCVLKELQVQDVDSPHPGSILFFHNKIIDGLYSQLLNNTGQYFYFTLSQIADNIDNQVFDENNPKPAYSRRFKERYKTLDCEYLKKDIVIGD